jgi:ElaB/YqjD/DUF883 family membrane-anchored ribosome-binding protein
MASQKVPFLSEEMKAKGTTTTISEVVQQAAAGIPPSNPQLQNVIETTKEFFEAKQEDPNLGFQARKVAHDVNKVLQDTEQFIEEKNADEQLQKMAVSGKAAAESFSYEARKAGEQAFKEGGYMGATSQETWTAAKDVVQQLVYSGEFRRLLMELVDVVESAFYRVKREAEESAQTPSGGLTEQVKQDIQEGTTEHIKEGLQSVSERVSYILREKGTLTDEEKSRLRTRLSMTLQKMKENPQFNRALNGFVTMIDFVQNQVGSVLGKTAPISSSSHIKTLMFEARTFLESFTSPRKIDRLIENVNGFFNRLYENERLNECWNNLRRLAGQFMDRPELLVDNDEFIRNLSDNMEEIQGHLEEMKDSPYTENILRESRSIVNDIKEDPLGQKLSSDTRILLQNFITYSGGQPQLNVELIRQMKGLLVPLLQHHLKYVPLGRIEGSDETYDYWFDNIVFAAGDLIPDQVHVMLHSEGDVNVPQLETQDFGTNILFKA